MKIRQFEKEDLYQLLAIQERGPETGGWSQADYLHLAEQPGGLILVAELETMDPPNVLGFAAYYRVIDEAELQNLAVHPEHRHQGLGSALLEEGSKRLLQLGAKRIFLEVRTSNKPALELYFAMGFGMHSLRKDYYRAPQEDALVLARELFPPAVIPSFP